MNITILTGSYNLNGTSNTLVDEFIKGAQEKEHNIKRFDTAHLNINACTGCNHCRMDGDCIFNDDMTEILNSIEDSDVLVFATPVYYFAMTAPLKATLDRFYSRTMRISSKRLKTILITTCWNSDDSTVNPVKWHYEKMVDYMHYDNLGMILGKGCGTVNMMPKYYYEEAFNLGKNI
ncbi:MAG: flavodoxin family protein [Methanosphaera sp.]|nr:flavodoxin family protein [Methanosphaera sp.]